MHSSKELRFRSLLHLVLAVLFSATMVAQSEGVSPAAESSPNRSVKHRIEILQHVGETAPTEAQAPPARFAALFWNREVRCPRTTW